MAPTLPVYRLFVGIDVAATSCAVAWMHPTTQPSRAITIDQTATGFADLQRQLEAIEPDPHAVLIVMEATGTYWMRLATSLVAAGFAVAVINPAQAHDSPKRCSNAPRPMRLMPKRSRSSARGSSPSAGPYHPRYTASSSSAWCIVMGSSLRVPSSATSCMPWCSNHS